MASFSFEWGTDYEAYPGSGMSRSLIDNEVRRLSRGVRERMGAEHNFGPYNEFDDGTHRRGMTTVCLKGNQATRDALVDVQEGSLFLMEVGASLELCIYYDAAWYSISSLDHGELDNLLTDSHPQYVKLAGDTMTGDLQMGGQEILLDSVGSDHVSQGLVPYIHAEEAHAAGLGSTLAIADGVISRSKFTWGVKTQAGTMGLLATRSFEFASPFITCPSFWASQPTVLICSGDASADTDFGLYCTGAGATYRINYRYAI